MQASSFALRRALPIRLLGAALTRPPPTRAMEIHASLCGCGIGVMTTLGCVVRQRFAGAHEEPAKASIEDNLGSSTTNSGSKRGLEGAAVYETSGAVNEYLQFHYATDDVIMPYSASVAPTAALGFPRRCAALTLAAKGRARALDVGCAVGGMTFELARSFEEVVGIDFSGAFVEAAQQVKNTGSCSFVLRGEGSVKQASSLTVIDEAIHRSRCSFEVGDACNLRPDLGTFDAVLATNLLCRLPEPQRFLERCAELVTPGGVLVLVSPYSWLPEYTRKENWLGGADPDGPTSFDALSSLMVSNGFELTDRKDMPFLMREHVRKFQWGCSDGTIWRRQG